MIKIRELCTADIDELAAFLSRQTGTSQSTLRDRLLWLARNPAATSEIPFGIGACRGDELCGAMLYVPMRFSDGVNTRTCVLSILFYVDAAARGAGLPLFMAFLSLADRYPLYASTANTMSAGLWSALGGSPVAGSEFEYVRVCRMLPVVAELILRASRQARHTRPDNIEEYREHSRIDRLAPVKDAESALCAIVQPRGASYALVCDAETIRWKLYEAGQTLYTYSGHYSQCLCAFQRSRRGLRSQVLALEILDVWGQLDPRDSTDFVSCIKQAFHPDIISFRGGSRLSGAEGLVRKFRRRQLPCPAVWLVDPHGLLENRFEYSSLAGE